MPERLVMPLTQRLRHASAPREALREWIQVSLEAAPVTPFFDGRIMMTEEACREAIPAAVLVALVNRPEGLQVLLTKRTLHLNDHAGQISFPGGRIEPSDRNPIHTALRESEEEIGLLSQQVRVLGVLREYFIPTGYRVIPVVGWVELPLTLKPDEFEVAEIFEVPLEYFFDPARHVIKEDVKAGKKRRYYSIPYQGWHIWGATAGILVDLYQVLNQGPGTTR
jgi:8-oxo-dGTP pyrophosphatase MutT (NUDIX family)